MNYEPYMGMNVLVSHDLIQSIEAAAPILILVVLIIAAFITVFFIKSL